MDNKERIRKMHHYKSIDEIPKTGGTISSAIFEEPKLQTYSKNFDPSFTDNGIARR